MGARCPIIAPNTATRRPAYDGREANCQSLCTITPETFLPELRK